MGIHFQRVIEEMCRALGVQDAGPILGGGKLQVDDFFITFVHDERFRPDRMYIYLDLGRTEEKDVAKVYKALLKLNFEMDGGERGSMCLHPENEHLFYSFFYIIDESACGMDLLDTIMSFIARAALDGFGQPRDTQEVQALTAAAGSRARASGTMLGPK